MHEFKEDDFFLKKDLSNQTYENIQKAVEKTTKREILIFRGDFHFSAIKSFYDINGTVKILGYMKQYNNHYNIITEFNENYMQPNLINILINDYLDSKGEHNTRINPTVRSKIIFGVAAIMKKIHDRNIFHRRLLDNIFLDDNLEPKINLSPLSYDINCEFEGFHDNHLYSIRVPHKYLTPECENILQADVYYYGNFLYSMF